LSAVVQLILIGVGVHMSRLHQTFDHEYVILFQTLEFLSGFSITIIAN
jgi:hypothetical protein